MYYLVLADEKGSRVLFRGQRQDLESIAEKARKNPRFQRILIEESLPAELSPDPEWRPASRLLPSLQVARDRI